MYILDAKKNQERFVPDFLVVQVGIEPTCDRLPFLQLIRLRGYWTILHIIDFDRK